MDAKTILRNVWDVAGVFIIWIVIHYASARFYPTFCAEEGLFGLVKSVFVTQAPHCVAMRWIIYNGGNMITTMWLTLSIWLTTKVFNKLLLKN